MSCAKSWDDYIAENYPWLLAQDEDGNWITLDNGQHIFIKEGENIQDALERHKIPIKLTKEQVFKRVDNRVSEILKKNAEKYATIPRHKLRSDSPSLMQIRMSKDAIKGWERSYGINESMCDKVYDKLPHGEADKIMRFATFHEIGHLQQMEEDGNMPYRYNESKKMADYYERDADKRAEKMSGSSRSEADILFRKFWSIEGEKKDSLLKKEDGERITLDDLLSDDVVIVKKKEIKKEEEKGETSSPVPAEWVDEIQKALDGWRDAVFIQDVVGVLKDPRTQKISRGE